MSFSERLKTIRLRRGLSQAELARLLGYSTGAIANWELGTNVPRANKLSEIASKLNCSVDFLSAGEEYDGQSAEGNQGDAPKNYGGPFYGLAKRSPIISWARAGDAVAYEDQGLDVEYVATDCKDPNCYTLKLEGDSMESKYQAGDMIVVAPNIQAQNGNLVIAKTIRDEVYFKVFHSTGSEGQVIRLTSYNPVYPPLEFTKQQMRFIHPVHSVVRVFIKQGKG